LSTTKRHEELLEKYWIIDLVRSFCGFSPRWVPMRATRSILLVVFSAAIKKHWEYLALISG
jgi:hypothetical protein